MDGRTTHPQLLLAMQVVLRPARNAREKEPWVHPGALWPSETGWRWGKHDGFLQILGIPTFENLI